MYKTIKISFNLVLLATVALVAILAYQLFSQNNPVSAQDKESSPEQSQESSENKSSDNSYTYTAQASDSYTKIARKAVQTYGIDNNVNLSQAGIVFAETQITKQAGSPELNVGEKVEISKETVKKYVEEAQKLTDSQQKAWSVYVPFVDFNTNSVGQAS